MKKKTARKTARRPANKTTPHDSVRVIPASTHDLHTEQLRGAVAGVAEQHDGYAPPEAIVEAAADRDSILHDQFMWDNTTAGHQYRLLQARQLVRRLMVTVVRVSQDHRDMEIKLTRQYESAPQDRHRAGGYLPVQRVLADPGRANSIILECVNKLRSLQERYHHLSELRAIWSAIDKVAEQHGLTEAHEQECDKAQGIADGQACDRSADAATA